MISAPAERRSNASIVCAEAFQYIWQVPLSYKKVSRKKKEHVLCRRTRPLHSITCSTISSPLFFINGKGSWSLLYIFSSCLEIVPCVMPEGVEVCIEYALSIQLWRPVQPSQVVSVRQTMPNLQPIKVHNSHSRGKRPLLGKSQFHLKIVILNLKFICIIEMMRSQ